MKRLKQLLQGKGMRHPLHPLLVHFPVGLFVFSFVFDLASLAFGPEHNLAAAAFYTMALALVTSLLAAVPGLIDYLDIRDDHPAKKTAIYHMALNLVMIGLYGCNLGLRYGQADAAATPPLPLLMSVLGIIILSISGYLGGTLVYDDGIGVGRHRRTTATPQTTIKPSADPSAPGGLLAHSVADASALKEGATLRVCIQGKVIAVAKLKGNLYAFQEFCTHRYGPLSEGKLENGQIQCPWHRSCFDVQTGKVVQGPAKEDLKVYPVEERDGKIWVSTEEKSP